MGTFQLSSMIILDHLNQCYKKVISINTIPTGILKTLIRKGRIEKISPFEQYSPCCSQIQCPLIILTYYFNLSGMVGCFFVIGFSSDFG